MTSVASRLIELAPRFVSELPSRPGRRRLALLLAMILEAALLAPFAFASPWESFGIPAAFSLAVATAAAVLVGTVEGVVVALLGAVLFAALVANFHPGALAAIGLWPLLVLAAGLFADRVGDHRARLEGQVERGNEQLRALVETGIGLNSELDLDQILQLLVEAAPPLTGAHAATLELVDARGAPTKLLTSGAGLPQGSGALSVPILVRGVAYGQLHLAAKDGDGAYTAADEELVDLLAAQAAVAIDNARLYESASRWSRQLESLTETSNALSAELELPSVLHLVARSLRELVGARTTAIWLPAGDGSLRVEAADGEDADGLLALAPLGRHSKTGRVFESGRAARVDSLLDDPLVDHRAVRGLGVEAGLWMPLSVGGERVGVLVALDKAAPGRRFTDEDARLAEVFAARAAAAIHVARRAEQEALSQVVAAQELERKRLALALHDGTAQALTSILLQLRAGASDVDQVRDLLVDTLKDVRRLAVELHPKALDDFGLVPALRRLTETVAESAGIEVHLEANLDGTRLAAATETAIYRIVQEALGNVARHAGAEHASVLVLRRGGSVSAIVEDDGRGFDPLAAHGGFGLSGIRERVRLLGGTLAIESRPGAGATVVAEVPLPEAGG